LEEPCNSLALQRSAAQQLPSSQTAPVQPRSHPGEASEQPCSGTVAARRQHCNSHAAILQPRGTTAAALKQLGSSCATASLLPISDIFQLYFQAISRVCLPSCLLPPPPFLPQTQQHCSLGAALEKPPWRSSALERLAVQQLPSSHTAAVQPSSSLGKALEQPRQPCSSCAAALKQLRGSCAAASLLPISYIFLLHFHARSCVFPSSCLLPPRSHLPPTKQHCSFRAALEEPSGSPALQRAAVQQRPSSQTAAVQPCSSNAQARFEAPGTLKHGLRHQ